MKFKEKFQRFMYGRYGVDEFSRALVYTSLGMMILHAVFKISGLDTLGMILLVYCYFRIFSRNIYKRAAENQKYLHIKDSFLQKFSRKTGTSSQYYANENGTFAQKVSDTMNTLSAKIKKKQEYARQLKDYRFFKCPTCQQKVRVPKGKGKIKIHCPRCHNDFIKKS